MEEYILTKTAVFGINYRKIIISLVLLYQQKKNKNHRLIGTAVQTLFTGIQKGVLYHSAHKRQAEYISYRE